MSRRIVLNPISRIEGEGSLEIVLDTRKGLREVRFHSDLFRGFEIFCKGRPVEEMPALSSRICGICAEAHYLASLRAVEQILGITVPLTMQKIRGLFLLTSLVRDHLTVLYLFAGPDTEDRGGADSLSWLKEQGLWSDFLASRRRLSRMLEILGGRRHLALGGFPGGWLRLPSEKEIEEMVSLVEEEKNFALRTWEFWEARFPKEEGEKFSWPLVALTGGLDGFLGERITVGSPEGQSLRSFRADKYRQHFREEETGPRGLRSTRLKEEGIYLVGPVARFLLWPPPPSLHNLYHRLKQCFKQFPWSLPHLLRVFEVLLALDKMASWLKDLDLKGREDSSHEDLFREEGIGVVEAPRGLLIHHYRVDEKGLLREVNIITPTAQNYKPLISSIQAYLKNKNLNLSKEVLLGLEKLIRTFDPCLPCMLHILSPYGHQRININSKPKTKI